MHIENMFFIISVDMCYYKYPTHLFITVLLFWLSAIFPSDGKNMFAPGWHDSNYTITKPFNVIEDKETY